ncbi:hypothetical protein AVEN_267324-1 [Araneus ventricosus]|uniref:Uncharacterized protein n=1 Tax=Araneus ventricosus TaxID=182803 RepID=A0A4Y2DJF9_ARAVE|nr:hypothetical protein AVEN_267324-1 [Araneus ventricosus]
MTTLESLLVSFGEEEKCLCGPLRGLEQALSARVLPDSVQQVPVHLGEGDHLFGLRLIRVEVAIVRQELPDGVTAAVHHCDRLIAHCRRNGRERAASGWFL